MCTVYLNVCTCLVQFLLLSQILFCLGLSWIFLLKFRVYISSCIFVVLAMFRCQWVLVLRYALLFFFSRDCFLQDVCVLGFFGRLGVQVLHALYM